MELTVLLFRIIVKVKWDNLYIIFWLDPWYRASIQYTLAVTMMVKTAIMTKVGIMISLLYPNVQVRVNDILPRTGSRAHIKCSVVRNSSSFWWPCKLISSEHIMLAKNALPIEDPKKQKLMWCQGGGLLNQGRKNSRYCTRKRVEVGGEQLKQYCAQQVFKVWTWQWLWNHGS